VIREIDLFKGIIEQAGIKKMWASCLLTGCA
jgi:hypothetical protein